MSKNWIYGVVAVHYDTYSFVEKRELVVHENFEWINAYVHFRGDDHCQKALDYAEERYKSLPVPEKYLKERWETREHFFAPAIIKKQRLIESTVRDSVAIGGG